MLFFVFLLLWLHSFRTTRTWRKFSQQISEGACGLATFLPLDGPALAVFALIQFSLQLFEQIQRYLPHLLLQAFRITGFGKNQ